MYDALRPHSEAEVALRLFRKKVSATSTASSGNIRIIALRRSSTHSSRPAATGEEPAVRAGRDRAGMLVAVMTAPPSAPRCTRAPAARHPPPPLGAAARPVTTPVMACYALV